MHQQMNSKEISYLHLIFKAHSNTETTEKTSSGYEFITARNYQKERTPSVSSSCAFQSPNNSLHSNSRNLILKCPIFTGIHIQQLESAHMGYSAAKNKH